MHLEVRGRVEAQHARVRLRQQLAHGVDGLKVQHCATADLEQQRADLIERDQPKDLACSECDARAVECESVVRGCGASGVRPCTFVCAPATRYSDSKLQLTNCASASLACWASAR